MDASANPRITPDLQAIVPNLHWRYSGVTATNRMIAPLLTRRLNVAWLGPDAPDGIVRMSWRDLFALRIRKPRADVIWHARRNNEMMVGLLLKALYYYYSSKHALLEAVLQRAFRYFDKEPLAEAREQWRDLPLRAALVESSVEAVQTLLGAGDLLRVSFSESFHGSKITQRRHATYQKNWIVHVETIVIQHADADSPSHRVFAEHLVGLLFGTCVDLILRPPGSAGVRRLSSRAYLESIVDHLLDGVSWRVPR